MKGLGYGLLIGALLAGGGIFCNVFTGLAVDQCSRDCPEHRTTALKTVFSIGPVTLKNCECPKN